MANGPLAVVLRHIRQWVGVQPRASLTDSQLLEEYVCRRDEAAFTALVERHAQLVFGVCRRMLSRKEDAEDAFQATFLVFARRASSIRRRQSLPAWLHGVARRVALKARLQAARRRDAAQRAMDETEPMTGPDTAEQAAQREASRVVDEELQHLPEKFRLPIILCYFEGRTYEEAAQELGLPSGSMGKRLSQAQERLRERLLRRGVTLSATCLGMLLASSAQAVPPMLTGAAIKAALLFAAGNSAAAAISERVVVLAQGVLHAMWIGRVKNLAMACGVMVLLLGGGGALMMGSLTAGPKHPQAEQAGAIDAEPAPAKKWQQRWAKSWKGEMIACLAMTPDGKTVAIGKYDGAVTLIEAATGKEIGTLGKKDEVPKRDGFPGAGFPAAPGVGGGMVGGFNPQAFGGLAAPTCMAFSPDGKTLATASIGATFNAFSPDGKALGAGSLGGTIELWDVPQRRSRARISTGEGANHSIQTVTFAPDGNSLVAGGGTTKDGSELTSWVKHWELATCKVIAEYSGAPPSVVSSLSFSPDGRSVAFTENLASKRKDNQANNVVKLLDLTTNKVIWQSEADAEFPPAVVHDPSSKVLALARLDGTVQVWDALQRRFQAKFKVTAAQHYLSRPAFSPDGRHFAVIEFVLPGNGFGFPAAGLIPEGNTDDRSVPAAQGPTLRLWNAQTGKLAQTVTFDQGFMPQWLAFSAAGNTLAVGGMGMEQGNQANPFGQGFQPFGGGAFPEKQGDAGNPLNGPSKNLPKAKGENKADANPFGFPFFGAIVGEVKLLNLKP
jgi:RNA polymerase sigma factor (sigma-70 family)